MSRNEPKQPPIAPPNRLVKDGDYPKPTPKRTDDYTRYR